MSLAGFMLLVSGMGVLTFLVLGLLASSLSTAPVFRAWEQEEGERFQSEIVQELIYLAGVYGQLQSRDVQERLQFQLNRDEFVILFSPEKHLILWAYDSLTHRVPLYSASSAIREIHDNTAEILRELLQQSRWNGFELDPTNSSTLFDYLASERVLHEIRVDDVTHGFVFTGVRQFRDRDLIAGLAGPIGLSVVGSLGVAFIISLILILAFSRKVRTHTAELAEAVNRIASGSRNVSFRRGSIRELNDIARATEQLQRDLSTGERSLHAWARHAAHDLRTPLAALSVQLDALIDGIASPSIETYEKMRERTDYLTRLANDFLMFTKIDNPGYTIEQVECNTGEILLNARTLLASYDIRLPDMEAPHLYGDPVLITRCFQNLFHNAVTHGSGEVTVEWIRDQERGWVTFMMRNPVAVGAQTDRGGESVHEGYGLGLSIVRTVVRLHGGGFEYHSSEGQVNVSLSLPEWSPR